MEGELELSEAVRDAIDELRDEVDPHFAIFAEGLITSINIRLRDISSRGNVEAAEAVPVPPVPKEQLAVCAASAGYWSEQLAKQNVRLAALAKFWTMAAAISAAVTGASVWAELLGAGTGDGGKWVSGIAALAAITFAVIERTSGYSKIHEEASRLISEYGAVKGALMRAMNGHDVGGYEKYSAAVIGRFEAIKARKDAISGYFKYAADDEPPRLRLDAEGNIVIPG